MKLQAQAQRQSGEIEPAAVFGFLSLIIIVYAISGRVNSFYIKSICYVVILILISIIVIKAITYEKK